MSAFDADTFFNTSVEGAIDTSFISVPVGEYLGQIDRLNLRSNQDGSYVMDVTWEILDEAVKKTTRMTKPTCRQGIFLDLLDNGDLDMSDGKNRSLGFLRAAVGQNTGKAWNPNMLLGQPATVMVEHSPNAKDPASPYANVVRVRKTG